MSVFTAYILDSGIVFAADKNITYDDGTKTWQEEGTKVFLSPAADALIGYVGAAETAGGIPLDRWLPDFLARNSPVVDPGATARILQQELQASMDLTQPSIVQFAAFANHGGLRLPEYWHIANVQGMNKLTGEYDQPGSAFGCSEEFLSKCRRASIADSDLRSHLQRLANSYSPSWFHQSIGLAVFNGIEEGAKASLRVLQSQGFVPAPVALADWEKHARYWILLYGAYYVAFYPISQQFVGGGADAISIAWP